MTMIRIAEQFGSTELWRKRQMNPGLDNLCRQLFANMKVDTPEELYRSMVYVYKKTLVAKMRHEGFKFRPVFRENRNEPTINKCDYELALDIIGKHLKVEITL